MPCPSRYINKIIAPWIMPQELLEFEFDYRYMMRGLIIDKRRGNVLKMDRHKYVKVAFHGFRPLSREERLATYANSLVGGGFFQGFMLP